MARRFFTADLHIHSCLSPCAELDMTPWRIMRKAAEAGLDIVAIADHNSCENLDAAARAALKAGVSLVPAMEITSLEEVHVLALFDTLEAAFRMQENVYRELDNFHMGAEGGNGTGQIPPFGQVIVNEDDEVLGFNRRILAGATGIRLSGLVAAIHSLGGMAIASHADRESFSVTSQLGFIPEGLGLDALEVCGQKQKNKNTNTLLREAPGLRCSDAHRLEDIGRKTTRFLLEEASLKEIALALKAADGRKAVFD